MWGGGGRGREEENVCEDVALRNCCVRVGVCDFSLVLVEMEVGVVFSRSGG
jgi:hypothetical protein